MYMQCVVKVAAACGFLLCGLTVSAAEAVDKSIADNIIAKLRLAESRLSIAKVELSQVDGVYKLTSTGERVLYASADGRFLIMGKMLEVTPDGLVDTHLVEIAPLRRDRIANIELSEMMVFPAKGERKSYINVFTDVACGLCTLLYMKIETLNARGIEVRYLPFPLAGIGSRSHAKFESAWCADDGLDAMRRLQNGESIPELSCQSPVAEHYRLGLSVGVNSVPAIVLADGTLLQSFRSAQEMDEQLNRL